MKISIDDIRNQEFSTEKRGYSPDEVDDFMDALAEQTEDLTKEIARLKAELKAALTDAEEAKNAAISMQNELDELKAAKAAEPVKEETAPVAQAQETNISVTYNEPSYFKNLETTLRETLISAQRIADETVDAARKKAKEIVAEAETKAAGIEEESQRKLADITAEYDKVKTAGAEYSRTFADLVAQQNELLKNSPLFAE